MKKIIITIGLVAIVTGFAQAQAAVESGLVPSKFFVSYGPSGAFINTKGKSSFGGGSALTLGWFFTKDLALYATSKGYHMDKAAFRSDDPSTYFRWGINGLGVRYSVIRSRAIDAFVDCAFLQSSIRPDLPEKLIFSGNGFSVGAGVRHFIAPRWSVSADVLYVYSKFRKQVDGSDTSDFDLNGHGVNISAGFAWHPFSNRMNAKE